MDPSLQPDPALLQAVCARAAEHYAREDFFCAEVRDRLHERLDLVRLDPTVIVDLGGGPGAGACALSARYPGACVINLDSSRAMLTADKATVASPLCADAHKLPLRDGSVDIVISNLMLPSCAEPLAVFAEARRVLRAPGGLLLFTSLGPDTLRELRAAWAAAEGQLTPRVQSFVDMHNVGDALVQAGFCEPVMDAARIEVRYAQLTRLVSDLRAMAATNVLRGRSRGLTTPRCWTRLEQALLSQQDADGRFRMTAEVISGQAWTGAADRGVGLVEGEARFPLSRLRP